MCTLTICQTCIILSSDTEQITQGSFGFHEKSEIFAVCPPWINYKIQMIHNNCYSLAYTSVAHKMKNKYHKKSCKKVDIERVGDGEWN
jgi:hypothetical protein